jgi:signal transduction histidine kinase
MEKRLLLIDDERPILEVLGISLAAEGYEVFTAESGYQGLEIFEREKLKLVVTDIKMPGMDGIEVLKRVKTLNPEAEVVVITGHGDMESAIAVLREGASDFITKPVKEEALLLALRRAERKIEMADLIKQYTLGLEEKVAQYKRELELAQEELLKRERLATIGETVAGLAHYIKNILNALKGGAYKVNSGLAKSDRRLLEEGWQMVQRNIERISQLSLDLLDFSKERVPDRTPCDPRSLVQEAASIIQPLADENNVELRLHLEEVGEAYWDKRGIHRVLVNLGTNAVDACRFDPERGKRFVVAMSLGLEKSPSGEERIVIEVSDNGSGMDEETREKVFSRFFSTKGGQGTGLGLLLSKKIVEEHGGQISFDSTLGQGTKFKVVLPRGSRL